MSFVKIREIAGTEVFRNTETGEEFFYDFRKGKLVILKKGRKGRMRLRRKRR